MFSWRCFPFVESAPRAYRLKASNAAPLSSTSAGTFPDLVLRGRSLYARATRTSLSQARPLFEKAIDLDPKYVPAYVGLGLVELYAVTLGWTSNAADAMQRAEKLATKAISLDEANSGAHVIMGRVLTRLENYDRALEELKRAIALNPSDADAYEGLSTALLFSGDFDGAIRAIDIYSEFQPSLTGGTFFNLGTALLLAGRSADSVRTLERSVERYPSISFNNAMLAAAYAAVGRTADAERQAAMVRRQFPYFSSVNFGSQFRNPQDREKLAAALKEAGL
jgi:adenylate cyclase